MQEVLSHVQRVTERLRIMATMENPPADLVRPLLAQCENLIQEIGVQQRDLERRITGLQALAGEIHQLKRVVQRAGFPARVA